MPRNRYAKEVHAEERLLIERQVLEMEILCSILWLEAHGVHAAPPPVFNEKETLRSERRAQARKHKPTRFRDAGPQSA